MKIHEYQAKKILKNYEIPIQDGYTFTSIEKAEETIKKVEKDFNTTDFVVKAQIHAGGRGKGGGVKYSPDFDSALENARNILGMNLITPQTGKNGKLVNKVFITEAYDISKEYYVAITLDREKKKDVFMVSTEGGVNIEEVAKNSPEKITKIWVNPNTNLERMDAEKLAVSLGFNDELKAEAVKIFIKLYKCYTEMDCTILEINPLIKSDSNEIIALDAKLNFDSNALYRHQDIISMRDLSEEDPMEIEANKFNLNYIKLDGNVGCMVNGAGLAMATMDIIKLSGAEPANFLDVGGAANAETIKNGFKIILKDKNVKAVLINIFGGIVRCDRVANGVVEAVNELGLKVPVVVRLEGTNAIEAKDILSKSNVKIIPADNFHDAALKVVKEVLK